MGGPVSNSQSVPGLLSTGRLATGAGDCAGYCRSSSRGADRAPALSAAARRRCPPPGTVRVRHRDRAQEAREGAVLIPEERVVLSTCDHPICPSSAAPTFRAPRYAGKRGSRARGSDLGSGTVKPASIVISLRRPSHHGSCPAARVGWRHSPGAAVPSAAVGRDGGSDELLRIALPPRVCRWHATGARIWLSIRSDELDHRTAIAASRERGAACSTRAVAIPPRDPTCSRGFRESGWPIPSADPPPLKTHRG